jgi:hypothetical protein
MSSTETSRPYQGHIMRICEEYAINEMSSNVNPAAMRPIRLPIYSRLENIVGTV